MTLLTTTIDTPTLHPAPSNKHRKTAIRVPVDLPFLSLSPSYLRLGVEKFPTFLCYCCLCQFLTFWPWKPHCLRKKHGYMCARHRENERLTRLLAFQMHTKFFAGDLCWFSSTNDNSRSWFCAYRPSKWITINIYITILPVKSNIRCTLETY